MDLYYAAINDMRLFALSAVSFLILAGIARGAMVARGSRARTARQIGEHAALGLDLFIGATLLNLAIDPTWTALATTATIIVVRKLLTISLSLPRRRAEPGDPTGP
jgi:uncharacterized membrane protein